MADPLAYRVINANFRLKQKANAEALFLKPGDVVECAFEKPAMVLRNRIVAPGTGGPTR